MHGEKLSADVPSGEIFKTKFSLKMSRPNKDPDFIYNADETALYWKAVPGMTLAAAKKKASWLQNVKETNIIYGLFEFKWNSSYTFLPYR
jgi:hypothetical protein